MRTFIYALFYTLLLFGCTPSDSSPSQDWSFPKGYSLDEAEWIGLPDELDEISGISWYKGQILAVEDESSVIYTVNPVSGKVAKKKKFEKNKDMEDILVQGDTVWALRSNGNLYQVLGFEGKKTRTTIYKFPREGKRDFESILLQEDEPNILVFCKICKWDENPEKASVFRFRLEDMEFDRDPFLTIHRDSLKGLLPDDSREKLKIQPSAVAKNPLSGDYYLLSSTGKWLMVLDKGFRVKEVHLLSPAMFKQPEGITFDPEGNLYISNEAQDGRANILKFLFRG